MFEGVGCGIDDNTVVVGFVAVRDARSDTICFAADACVCACVCVCV